MNGRILCTCIIALVCGTGLYGGTSDGNNHDQVDTPIPVIVHDVGLTGNGNDAVTCIKRTSDGKFLVGGWTSSVTFDGLAADAMSARTGAGEDGFIARISADASTIEYVWFLSASKNERIHSLALTSNGNICAVGETTSPDFPVTGTTFGQQRGNGTDAFVVVLNSSLTTQVAGFLLPGNGNDVATGVVVNAHGHVVVVGNTTSTSGFSASKVLDDTANGGTDGFVMIVNSSLLYADFFTFLGGTGEDVVAQVALDQNNAAIVCGTTKSQDFYTFPKKIRIPTGGGGGKGEEGDEGEGGYKEVGKNPYNHIFNGGESDAFVAKFGSDGESIYSTYLGGSGADVANSVFVDSEGGAFVVGRTTSSDFPTSSSSTTFGGQTDGFAAVITSDGLRLSGATYIGGAGYDEVNAAMSFDATSAVVVGRTLSSDLQATGVGSVPIVAPSAFVAICSISNVSYVSGTAIEGDEFPSCMTLDNNNDVVFGGTTFMAQQPQAGDPTSDAFIGKNAFGLVTYTSPTVSGALCAGQPVQVKWSLQGFSKKPATSLEISVDAGNTWTLLAANLAATQFDVVIPPTVPAGTTAILRVSTDRGHSVISPRLTVSAAPTFMQQPLAQVVCPTTSVVLSVSVSDAAATVQWTLNGASISGATGPELTLANIGEEAEGTYAAIVTNACGSITSEGAQVDVTSVPLIDEQPQSVEADLGATVGFTTVARGTDLTYQWQKDNVDIAGATGTEYTIVGASATHAGSYACVVTMPCGSTTTESATLSIKGTTGVTPGYWSDGTAMIIYPQPTSSTLSVNVPAIALPLSLSVYSLQGVLVLQSIVNPSASEQAVALSVDALPSGTYILRSSSAELTATTRFVVSR